MGNLITVVNRITNLVTQTGYAPKLYYDGKLSGYQIVKYYIERSEKYNLGLAPSGTPDLSYALSRMVYDGIAYQQYLEWNDTGMIWNIPKEKNYYYFRYHFAATLDISYMLMMSDSTFLDVDVAVVSTLFSKIKSLIAKELKVDISLERNKGCLQNQELKFAFEELHVLGRSIYICWTKKMSPRFRLINKLISASNFNPWGI